MSIKISYVLPVYNQQSTIASCIYSLLKQKNQDSEIIVINDGSTDHTNEIVMSMIDNGKEFTYISNKNRIGGAKCRNRANLDATGGRYRSM